MPETILYLDFPAENDNYLRKLAGVRRYALFHAWKVEDLLPLHDAVSGLRNLTVRRAAIAGRRPAGCPCEEKRGR